MTLLIPKLIFLSGSISAGSKSDRIASWCARQCAAKSTTVVFSGQELEFPFYRPFAADSDEDKAVRAYLNELRTADGVVLVSPAYHGTVSGLLKNALDYVNELATDAQPYLDGRGIGCVTIALGEQGATSTLATLRTIAHALRGWPTPMGVTLSKTSAALDDDDELTSPDARTRLQMMLDQVLTLAKINCRRRQQAASRAARVEAVPEPANRTRMQIEQVG